MSKQLRVYTGNYDGKLEGLVIAENQKEATKAVGCSLRDFRDFWRETGVWPEGESHCPECGATYSFMHGRLYTRIDQFRTGSRPEWYIGRAKEAPHA
jgi:hypothetical protein